MLSEQTLSTLNALKLFGMAHGFSERLAHPKTADLSHEEFLGLLVQDEKTYRENLRLKRLLKNAKLQTARRPRRHRLQTSQRLKQTDHPRTRFRPMDHPPPKRAFDRSHRRGQKLYRLRAGQLCRPCGLRPYYNPKATAVT